jgi:hypothetical protein
MGFIEIFMSELKTLVYIIPFMLLILSLILFGKKLKSKLRMKIIEDEEREKMLIKDKLDFFEKESLDDQIKFKKDVQEITQKINSGEENIKVDFSKAMYLLKNFKRYNVFANEDGKIIFEKLKIAIDENSKRKIDENKIDFEENLKEVEKTESYSVSMATTERLPDGSIKVSNVNGYTIVKDNKILEFVDLNEKIKEEETKKEEAKNQNVIEEINKKLANYDEVLLRNKSNLDEGLVENETKTNTRNISQDKMADEVNELMETYSNVNNLKKRKPLGKKDNIKSQDNENDNIASSIAQKNKINYTLEDEVLNKKEKVVNENSIEIKIVDEEISEEHESKKLQNITEKTNIINEDLNEYEKEQNNYEEINIKKESKKILLNVDLIKKDFVLLEDYDMIFILSEFEEKFKDKLEIIILSLLNVKNLMHKEDEIIITDLDLERKNLFIDTYLFLVLLSKFYKDSKKFLKEFTHSEEIINLSNFKKLVLKLNELFHDKYGQDFFIFVGKRNIPFIQRNLKYKINEVRYISTQMMIIDSNFNDETFKKCLSEIKEYIFVEYKPEVYKKKMNNNNLNELSIDLNLYYI